MGAGGDVGGEHDGLAVLHLPGDLGMLPAHSHPTVALFTKHGHGLAVTHRTPTPVTPGYGWNDCCHPFTWTKAADEILPHAAQ